MSDLASYNVPFRRLMIVYCLWRLLPSVPSVIQNQFLFDIQHDTEQGAEGGGGTPVAAPGMEWPLRKLT